MNPTEAAYYVEERYKELERIAAHARLANEIQRQEKQPLWSKVLARFHRNTPVVEHDSSTTIHSTRELAKIFASH